MGKNRSRNLGALTLWRYPVKGGLLLLATTLPHVAAATSPCVPPIEVAQARAVRIEKNGVIVLADGREARTEGLLLPAGAGDHAPQNFATDALVALANLVTGHSVALAAEPPKEDRYGRIRAQIIRRGDSGDVWLQEEMLRKGLARVAIAPDRNECVAELYAIEAEARAKRAGIWSSAAYAVRSPSQLDDDVGTFQIVEGTVARVSESGGRVFLDFGADEGFAATISSDDRKRFREIGVDPYAYAHQTVRSRGFVTRIHDRPEMELATPGQVEIVDTPRRGLSAP